MKVNLTDKIGSINKPQPQHNPEALPEDATTQGDDNPFKIPNKIEDKRKKVPIQIYMDNDLLKKLDKVCKDKKYSRNEFINLIIKTFVDKVE